MREMRVVRVELRERVPAGIVPDRGAREEVGGEQVQSEHAAQRKRRESTEPRRASQP